MQILIVMPDYMSLPAGFTWKYADILPPPGSLVALNATQNVKVTHYRYRNDLPATLLSQAVVEVYVEEA